MVKKIEFWVTHCTKQGGFGSEIIRKREIILFVPNQSALLCIPLTIFTTRALGANLTAFANR